MSGSNFGLAPPVVVNPLAAQTTALDAAGKVYQLRQQQSKEAAGQAFQNSLNPDGTPNQSAFLSNLKANPTAAMSALETAQQGQTLDHNTYVTHSARVNAGMAGMGQLIADNPAGIPADAAHAFIERQVALGYWTPDFAKSLHAQVSDNPRANTQLAVQGLSRGLQAQTVLEQARPSGTFDTGGNLQPYSGQSRLTSGPYTGGITPQGGGVNRTLSPGEAMTQVTFQADQDYVRRHPDVKLGATVSRPLADVTTEQGFPGILPPGARITTVAPSAGTGGVIHNGQPASPTNPPRLNVPGSAAPPAPPAVQQGGPPPAPPGGSGTPYSGGGFGQAIPAAPAAAPATAAPVAPVPVAPASPAPPVAPSVNAPTDSMMPGPRSALEGGVPVASINPLAPSTGAGSPPSPAVAGDVSAILRGMQNARASQSRGTQVAGDAVRGPGIQETSENQRAAELLTTHDTAAANYQQTIFPYTQALSLYGRGMTTAPTTDQVNAFKGWANALARSTGVVNEPFDSTKEYDALHKYLSQIVSGNPVAAGSDARMAAVLSGNANTGIHELAGADMIKAGVALQRMTVALNNQWHAMPSHEQALYGGNYMNYLRDQAAKVDVRAFARDLYNPEQIKTLQADLQNGSREDRLRFLDTLRIARAARLVGDLRVMP